MKVRKPRPKEHGPAGNGKCFDCACCMATPEGKWCLRHKRVPTRAQTKRCKQRLPLAALHEPGCEEDEEVI
jgi:hypothetical protein